MIEIKQLYKSYGELEVLKDINLTVNTGEIYGLVGRSGAGKSTLLRCINGLENYQSGSLKIDGTEMKDLSKTQLREFQKEIGMIFQHFNLLASRTVFDNIAFPLEIQGLAKTKSKSAWNRMLEHCTAAGPRRPLSQPAFRRAETARRHCPRPCN